MWVHDKAVRYGLVTEFLVRSSGATPQVAKALSAEVSRPKSMGVKRKRSTESRLSAQVRSFFLEMARSSESRFKKVVRLGSPAVLLTQVANASF